MKKCKFWIFIILTSVIVLVIGIYIGSIIEKPVVLNQSIELCNESNMGNESVPQSYQKDILSELWEKKNHCTDGECFWNYKIIVENKAEIGAQGIIIEVKQRDNYFMDKIFFSVPSISVNLSNFSGNKDYVIELETCFAPSMNGSCHIYNLECPDNHACFIIYGPSEVYSNGTKVGEKFGNLWWELFALAEGEEYENYGISVFLDKIYIDEKGWPTARVHINYAFK